MEKSIAFGWYGGKYSHLDWIFHHNIFATYLVATLLYELEHGINTRSEYYGRFVLQSLQPQLVTPTLKS